MDTTGGPAAHSTQAGTLTLAVWPDTPLGEHQRYGYRIIDATTGRSLEGRDLFTGAGAPVAPDRAMRDLAGFLGAAGEARQYVLDHPGHTPEHEGLFPGWVAEAARRNADALALLADDPPDAPLLGEPDRTEPGRRWISVVFLQGSEADEVLDLIDQAGTDAAIEHLADFDYGEDTVQAAMENGYVYDAPPAGATDRLAVRDVYALTYNHALGHVGLLRELDSLPDPDLLGIDTTTPTATRPATSPPRSEATGGGRDWFAASPGMGASRSSGGRGLAL